MLRWLCVRACVHPCAQAQACRSCWRLLGGASKQQSLDRTLAAKSRSIQHSDQIRVEVQNGRQTKKKRAGY